MRASHPHLHPARQSGMVLLAVLVFLLLTTLGASAMVELQRTNTQRAQEIELLFVGDQYRRAIQSYYNSVPAGRGQALPRSLDDLLEDKRFPMPVRHLRRLYPDPMTGKTDWVIVQGANGIIGVHSRSRLTAFMKWGFPVQYREFQIRETYAEWKFVISLN
jgi:type II secretory pathway pseudopilin PulG